MMWAILCSEKFKRNFDVEDSDGMEPIFLALKIKRNWPGVGYTTIQLCPHLYPLIITQ